MYNFLSTQYNNNTMPKIKLDEGSAIFSFNDGGSNYFNCCGRGYNGLKIYRWMSCDCENPAAKFTTVIEKDNLSQCQTSATCYSQQIKSTINSKKKDGTYTNDNSYSYSNAQYLRKKCRIYDKNLPASYTIVDDKLNVYGNCAESPNCTLCPITYKPNNATFSTQGAVSTSERLLRLKYNTIAGDLNNKTCCKRYTGDSIPFININKKEQVCNNRGLKYRQNKIVCN